jgi:hypothetical protein
MSHEQKQKSNHFSKIRAMKSDVLGHAGVGTNPAFKCSKHHMGGVETVDEIGRKG